MKQINQYIKLSLVLVLTCNSMSIHSQTAGTEENNMFNNTFTSSKLSGFELKGFENRAIQKVHDFGDYLAIVSNKEYDPELRKKAIQMLEKHFVGIDTEILKPEKAILDLPKVNLTDYFRAILESPYSNIDVKISNVGFDKPLKLTKDGKYKGQISFSQANYYIKDKKQLKKSLKDKKIQILLVKTSKTFGDKKESVWNVYLGDISSE